MHLLEIMVVVVFIILDWTFVLMNTTTMIPCRRVSYSEGTDHLFFSHDLKVNESQDLQQFHFQCWIELQLHVVTHKSQAIDKDKSARHKRVMNL